MDLKREVDLIEEVARLYGVDRIPATAPRGATGSNSYDAVHDQYAEVRRLMTGMGLFETQGQTLHFRCGSRPGVEPDADSSGTVSSSEIAPLANPLSSDMNVLRPSLLPGLLDALRHNLNHKNEDARSL